MTRREVKEREQYIGWKLRHIFHAKEWIKRLRAEGKSESQIANVIGVRPRFIQELDTMIV